MSETHHASVVARGGRGVMLLGASGSGKSDLALRLIDRGYRLVADDRACLRVDGQKLMAAPPERLAGLIELYGLGIYRLPHQAETALNLVVRLVAPDAVERMPPLRFWHYGGLRVPEIHLAAFHASTPQKIDHSLDHPPEVRIEDSSA